MNKLENAAERGDVKGCRRALRRGVPKNRSRQRWLDDALASAIIFHRLDPEFKVARLLLKHGADPNSALDACWSDSDVEELEFLVANGADPTSEWGRGGFQEAVTFGDERICREYFRLGGDARDALSAPYHDEYGAESDRARKTLRKLIRGRKRSLKRDGPAAGRCSGRGDAACSGPWLPCA